MRLGKMRPDDTCLTRKPLIHFLCSFVFQFIAQSVNTLMSSTLQLKTDFVLLGFHTTL